MRAVLTRVKYASVTIDGETVGKIGPGFLILLGVGPDDTEECARVLAEKALGLRIFEDENGKLNLSVLDVKGNVMVVSNFTLYADTRKGRRPSFDKSARPEISKPLYDFTVKKFSDIFENLVTGEFGAYMQISLENDGPVTLIVEKENE